MNEIFAGILILLTLVLCVLAVRGLAKEFRGPVEDEPDRTAGSRRTEERKNEKIRKEIEQWRNGR